MNTRPEINFYHTLIGATMKYFRLSPAFLGAISLIGVTAWAHAHGAEASADKQAIDYTQAEDSAFGKAADPKKTKRIIRIEMSDKLRFVPDKITLKKGAAVKFVIKNTGKIKHEFVLGTLDELKEHSALMKKFPGMEHDEPSMADVAPGKTAEITWKFTHAGEFYYGCLVPGHFEGGMVGKVIVK
jgi:uncharacterized cupredoxin-like copper-binding protein